MPSTGVRLTWPDGDRLDEGLRAMLIGDGAPFELREEPVRGVPMAVFVQRPRTITQLLTSAAERHADRPYLVFPDRRYTFAEVVAPVAVAAARLRDEYGIGKGDRVAVAAANCAEYAVMVWAVTALGGITVAMNGWWTAPEMVYGVELTEPKVVFVDQRRGERIAGTDLRVPVVELGREWSTADVDVAGAPPLPTVDVEEDDPFLIQFTSGTTGRPKGALISHRSTIQFIWASMLGGAIRALTGEGGPAAKSDFPPCVISAAPMFHVAGLNAQLLMAPVAGMTIVYPPPGRWEEATHLRLTQENRATTWSLVPTQLWRLLDFPDLDHYDLSSVSAIGGGSAVWPPELLRLLGERLPGVRPGLALGYGMTETSGLGTGLRGQYTVDHPDSVGEPNPGVEVEVRDQATNAALPEGEVGEICMRTAAVFLGYWRNPEATAAAIDDEGWYHTGDFGHIREGLLFLEGRRQDLIIRGGENIYPAEIENRLLEHPDIGEVAVVGVPHQQLGQEVKAVVVPAAGRTIDAESVRSWAGGGLASFKVPTHVEFATELPRNAMGKVLKHLIGNPEKAANAFVAEE